MSDGSDNQLLFVPLGGAGEIGMNLNLYAYGDAWIIVDLGITFADSYLPGVEILMPDPSFIEERRDKLLGIVLTHAHEDHLGAVAHLWPRLRCPVYATPFAGTILGSKLSETGIEAEVPLYEIPRAGAFTLGPFDIRYFPITHSIAEANGLVIRTPAGTIFHTGDWKFDSDPVICPPTDEAALKALGDEGVLALVCDSTNVFNQTESGSEAAVGDNLREVLADHPGRILVTTFASNIARLASLGRAAVALDRHLCLVGRSLIRNVEVARALGYLDGFPPLVDESEVGYLPREKVMIVSTGCQGEGRAALSRIAQGQHRHIALGEGDLVVFSSKQIPGNELAIGRLINNLAEQGIKVMTERDAFIHVSGHPSRPELERMYDLIRPEIAVPVHGERRHLMAHAELARQKGAKQAVVVTNGKVVRLAPGPAEVVDEVKVGRLALDGDRLVPVDGDVIATRRRIMYNGYLGVAVAVDGDGHLLAKPSLDLQGIPGGEAGGPVEAAILRALDRATEGFKEAVRRDDRHLAEGLRIVARRAAKAATGKETGPITKVHVIRVQ
ncbi:MAG: ribonuclease J [Alphaproteobacteria bacterium]|nr:MAG: ribonuclease J [Alphaproteobacteria bacterium]